MSDSTSTQTSPIDLDIFLYFLCFLFVEKWKYQGDGVEDRNPDIKCV